MKRAAGAPEVHVPPDGGSDTAPPAAEVSSSAEPRRVERRLDWLDPLRALALGAVLLNHLVEAFGPGPWFTNPTRSWPDLATRMRSILPPGASWVLVAVRFLGWLGDAAPGVFVLVSGVGLTWSALVGRREPTSYRDFLVRRVARIFPLYLAAHAVVFAGALFVPSADLTTASPRTLMSLLGLRITRSLFFAIAPAWWFVWLILQLYLVFPLLLRLLERLGTVRFLLVTCAFTFAARALGLVAVTNLYPYMTGLFFGTRLAEFAAGMAIAALLARREDTRQLEAHKALAVALPVYAAGFAVSLTWWGSVVSELLVTLGMSGVFYAAWRGLLSRRPGIVAVITWLGAQSYAIYLLHHAPLEWTAEVTHGRATHLAASLATLVLSIPAGWLMDLGVVRITSFAKQHAGSRAARGLSTAISVVGVAAVIRVAPTEVHATGPRAVALVLGLSLAVLIWAEWSGGERAGPLERVARWTAIPSLACHLFVTPFRAGPAYVAVFFVFAVCATLLARIRPRVHAWVATGMAAGVALGASEMALRQWDPIEAGAWGELPALQEHPTRIYGLKPSSTTHLRYNAYDYAVKSNALGLAGPEVTPARPTPDTLRVLVLGDAFTMPEGLNYEQSYCAFLQEALSRRLSPRRVEVIDAGVTGYGPVEEAAQLRELAPLLRPDVVVYEFFINEFEEAQLTPPERLKQIGLGVPLSPRRLFDRSKLRAALAKASDRVRERLTGQPSGWRFDQALLGFYEAGDNPLYGDPALLAVRRQLTAMSETVAGVSARMLIVFVPGAVAVERAASLSYFPMGENLADASKYDMDRPLRALEAIAEPLRIQVLDLTGPLKRYTERPVYFTGSWHWTEAGHRAAAGAIEEALFARAYL